MKIIRYGYLYDIFSGIGWELWTRVRKVKKGNKTNFVRIDGDLFTDTMKDEFFRQVNQGLVK